MTTIIVSPISQIPQILATRHPSHVLTLLSPDTPGPDCAALPAERHLSLFFHDMPVALAGYITPDRNTIQTIFDFAATWDRTHPMLVHCWAGVSRSTAAAFILCCKTAAPGRERAIADHMRRVSPFAMPNTMMISLADKMLGRDGRMTAAVAAIGQGTACTEAPSFDMDLALVA